MLFPGLKMATAPACQPSAGGWAPDARVTPGSRGARPLCGRGPGAGRPLRARPISARARRAGAGARGV